MTQHATSYDLKQALLQEHQETVVVFRIPENNAGGYRDIMALASQTALQNGTATQPEELRIEATHDAEVPLGLQHAYERLGMVGLISGNKVPFVLVTATGSFPLKTGFTVTQNGQGMASSLIVDMR